jgi:hypothetical protein
MVCIYAHQISRRILRMSKGLEKEFESVLLKIEASTGVKDILLLRIGGESVAKKLRIIRYFFSKILNNQI